MGVNMGYQPGPRESVFKKYAYFPIKTSSNKWVWFNVYYEIQTYYDENGRPPVKSLFWKRILNKNEYLFWLITAPKTEVKIPNAKSAVYYCKEF